jgi:DNA-directed RNA polymerase specialized sigma subunit
MTEDQVSEWSNLVNYITYEFSRRYYMVDKDDIRQEIWLWFLTHDKKVSEWEALDKKEQTKLVNRSIRNAALKFCEKEKARIIGYDVSDLFYYDRNLVEIFLPSILTKDYKIPEGLKTSGDNSRSTKDPAFGNDWIAMRADISRGYDLLTEKHQEILRLRFLDESRTLRQLGDSLGITEEATRKRIDRAIKSLINKIGGTRPR